MSRVSVFNEWDPLEEIIVGTAKYAKFPENDPAFTAVFGKENIQQIPQKIIEETEEDLETLVQVLENMNIVVHRPQPINFPGKYKTLDWEVENYFCYCPRDTLLTVGDMIIETPNLLRSRYFENFAYQQLLIEYMNSGSKWISAPKPRLQDNFLNINANSPTILNNFEPIFDAANVLKIGKDILYMLSDGGNELGLQWLKNILGDKYRIHTCKLYKSLHLDTTLCPLRPGLVLANPERVNAQNIPEIFKKWDIIYSPPMENYTYSTMKHLTSSWLGMNLLMVSPTMAIVDSHQPKLIKLIEDQGIEVIPMLLRHGQILAGGFHCVTLDIKRAGQKEDYCN